MTKKYSEQDLQRGVQKAVEAVTTSMEQTVFDLEARLDVVREQRDLLLAQAEDHAVTLAKTQKALNILGARVAELEKDRACPETSTS